MLTLASSVREAIILCGGQGSRLRNTLPDLPKVLAPIAGRPFISYQLCALANLGIKRVILCTGYMADAVHSALGAWQEGMELTYSREEAPLGTGGALRLALPHITGSTVLVLNGDSYFCADLSPMTAPLASPPPVLLAAAALKDTTRFGRLLFTKDGDITAFTEKGLTGPGHINAGIYRFTREAVVTIAADRPVSLEREVFPMLIGNGLTALPLTGAFLDIGTAESYAAAEDFFAAIGNA